MADVTVQLRLLTTSVYPQLDSDSDANQCAFGEMDRAALRGGPWIATVADFPQPSLYVRPRPSLILPRDLMTADSAREG
jgi:hypothetical protein